MPRRVLDMVALDLQLEEELVRYGSIWQFRITLWRQAPDASGCNWNARVDRLLGGPDVDSAWWEIVPRMREQFNLPEAD